MSNTKINWSRLASMAAGTLAVMGVAHAQMADGGTMAPGTMGGTTMTPGMTMPGDSNMNNAMMGGMMQPMTVTGTVVRYYVDRAGYVSAMDVQTTDGVKMAQFAPGMGQRLFTTYPVGSQITAYATATPMGKMTRMDVVGVGETMPTTMMQPFMATDLQLLEAEPYIQIGSKLVTVRGTLKGVVTNDMGEVLALVVSGAKRDGTMANMDALVRVARSFRAVGTQVNVGDSAAPLFKGADVEAVGYEEAPRYGALSNYSSRLVANTITVNGRSTPQGSVAPMMMSRSTTILGVNLFGNMNSGMMKTTMSPEEMNAGKMGYTGYQTGGMQGGTDMGTGGGTMGGTGTMGTDGTMTGGGATTQ